MANGYRINRSNYTLRKRHQNTSQGIVYERDFMTTTNLGAWDSGVIHYGENNFRMMTHPYERARRINREGIWLLNEDGGYTWTLNDLKNAKTGYDHDVRLKPNYHSLLDFAYFGNCTELIKSTINKIIEEFPGSLYTVQGSDKFDLGGIGKCYVVNNPFGVDFVEGMVPKTAKHPEKLICTNSQNQYQVDGADITSVSINRNSTARVHGCLLRTIILNGNKELYEVYYGDQVLLFSENHIRISPKPELIDAFFENLDDFSLVLLDRETSPKFTATFDYPHETEEGFKTYRRRFTWPVESDNLNLDVISFRFTEYVNSLLTLAEFYDENYSDNLWRMLTHDAIKTMDASFSRPENDEDEEDYNFGISKLKGLFWAYGRQFDELKRAIAGIKNNNRVTYAEDSNIPDRYLSESVELSGWEIYDVRKGLKEGTTLNVMPCVSKEYTLDDMAMAFLRNLKLNSKAIFSRKGTRHAIEMIMGMFGLKSYDKAFSEGKTPSNNYDYKLTEQVVVVKKNDDGELPDVEKVAEYNTSKYSYPTDGAPDDYYGLPVAVVEYTKSGGTVEKYIIPWFKKGELYDGGMYFQMYGGWGRLEKRQCLLSGATVTELGGTWDETVKYLHGVERISELRKIPRKSLFDGCIYYVYDIDDLKAYYGENIDVTLFSHYFSLERADEGDEVNGENGYGWKNIPNSDIFGENPYGSGLTVLYLESIIEDFKANNPHVGYGKYDAGKEYLKFFEQLFYDAIKNDSVDNPSFRDGYYDCDTGKLDEEIGKIGWKVELQEDNMKCWFFSESPDNLLAVIEEGGELQANPDVKIGSEAVAPTFDSKLSAYDFDTGKGKNSVFAADSIINVKNIKLELRSDYAEFEDYFYTTIYPYLKQVIPSTAIFEISFVQTAGVMANAADVMTNTMTYVDAVYVDKDDNTSDDIIDGYRSGEITKDADDEGFMIIRTEE